MDSFSLLSSLSNFFTIEEFIDIFLKKVDDKYIISINDKLKISCKDFFSDNENDICNKDECKECWAHNLYLFGFESSLMEQEIEKEYENIIDISNVYSFYEMLEELKNNSELSFICNNKIYFMKNDKLKEADYNNCKFTPYAEDCIITKELLESKYMKTNIYNSTFLESIEFEDVKELLLSGERVMLVCNEHVWLFYCEGNAVYLSYDGNEEINENNFLREFTTDILSSFHFGEWLLVSGDSDDI